MTSKDQIPPHCDHETCQIQRPHCHICDNGSCGLERPHCHVCLHEEEKANEPLSPRPVLSSARNDTQPGSVKYQAELFQQMLNAKERRRSSSPSLDDGEIPEVAYHSAQWQPSYAVGGGTDLTKMLRPTGHRTFSWGGPGTTINIPSPEGSRSSSAPASRGEDYPNRPPMPHLQSNRMREVLRRRLDERAPSGYAASERAAVRTPLPIGSPQLRATPTGQSPMMASPTRTPPVDKTEQRVEHTPAKRPGLARGLSKGTFKGIKKGLEKATGSENAGGV